MLKGLVPIRDIFLFHKIYILFDVIFIQCVIIKVGEIIVFTHLHETGVKASLTAIMKVNRYSEGLFCYRMFILSLEVVYVIKYLFIYVND